MKVSVCMSTILMAGRKSPPNLDDYRPTVVFDDGIHHSCQITKGGIAPLGVWTAAEIKFLDQSVICPEEFCIYEGPKLVGWGTTKER
jgi:hypothetical protein